MSVLKDAIDAAKAQKKKVLGELCSRANACQADIERTRAVLDLFDSAGYEAFRRDYIQKVRLPQLYGEAAKALGKDEATRLVLAGQIAEAEAMSAAKMSLENDLRGLTRLLDSLESDIARERKRSKDEGEGQA